MALPRPERGERGAVDRVDGDVGLGRRAVADALAVEEHRRFVLLALADDDDAVHRHGVEHDAAWRRRRRRRRRSLSPRPIQRDAARAAASVTRTSSRARLRSGTCLSMAGPSGARCSVDAATTVAGDASRTTEWQGRLRMAYARSRLATSTSRRCRASRSSRSTGPDDGESARGSTRTPAGPYASMYRSKLWTMRMFAGFGTAIDTNRPFHEILARRRRRAVDRVRPADAHGPRLRRPAERGRGRQVRRRRRHAGRHGGPLRRHRPRRGHHVDDDQLAGRRDLRHVRRRRPRRPASSGPGSAARSRTTS